ncbi:MAG TPA: TlpA disulfide reductase family protein [Gemmatimonadales bacterium]|jgi:thiol-disulfide isomerase/thioredoxin|nr:TlpA disulfide reductase family protein [Gemmatimonadales bacterium]
MSKQWALVIAVVAGLGLGAAALVKFGPKIEGVDIGKRAPDYRMARLGTTDSVSIHQEAKGQVTLINIWATWCIPCRAEMPAMEKLYQELGPKGLRILAVSIDEGDARDVQQFVQELGLTFEILHDRSGGIQRVYQTTGVPESFLLDKNGMIVKKVIGEHPWGSPSNQRIVANLLGGDE